MSRCNFASARRKFDGVLTSRSTQARLHVAPSRMKDSAVTGLIIGSPSIAPGRGDVQQGINVDEVIRMIGGAYRLASIAVDIGADELERQSRRVPDELRVRRRLWRRRKRLRTSPALPCAPVCTENLI